MAAAGTSFRRPVACSRSAPICVPTPRPSTRRRWHRIFPWPMPRNRISSSAPGANSASPISWSGSSPTPNFISPSVTGRTSLREISTRRSNGIVRGSVDSVAPAPNWPVRPELTRDRIGGASMLKQRVLTAVVLLLVLLGALLAPSPWPLIVLLLVMAGCALWEWLRLSLGAAWRPAAPWIAIFTSIVLLWLVWTWMPTTGAEPATEQLVHPGLLVLAVVAWAVLALPQVLQGRT